MAAPTAAAASVPASVATDDSPAATPVTEQSLAATVIAGQHHHGSQAEGDKEASSNWTIQCKWKTHTYDIVLPASATVGFLKMQIALLSNVRPWHQKLMFPSAKLSPGTKLHDEMFLSSLNLKQPPKAVMVGNPEDELILDDAAKAAANEPVDDLDYDYRPDQLLELGKDPTIRAKVEKYWNAVKDTFTLINPIRPGKKLLVLDLDYTLFDMKGTSEDWRVLKRPGTHRFLTAMYQHYEIVIWSQTSWRWLELKLTELGILTHPAYKVCFVLDKTSMFSIHSPDGNGGQRKHHVKCLELIWRRFPASAGGGAGWSAANTIHVDDLGRNFALNPQSGLKIAPYKNSDKTRQTDAELKPLGRYLESIAALPDFTKLDHGAWKKHVANLPPQQ